MDLDIWEIWDLKKENLTFSQITRKLNDNKMDKYLYNRVRCAYKKACEIIKQVEEEYKERNEIS